jgi:hypothetical protein
MPINLFEKYNIDKQSRDPDAGGPVNLLRPTAGDGAPIVPGIPEGARQPANNRSGMLVDGESGQVIDGVPEWGREHPNLWAAGKAIADIPQGLSELGERIVSGATLGLSDRVGEFGEYLAEKLTGQQIPKREKVLRPWLEATAEMAGSFAPLSAAEKTVVLPIVKKLSKTKEIKAFQKMIGWGAAGSAYSATEKLIKEGELPSPKEIAEDGALWAGIEGLLHAAGLGGKFSAAVNRLAKTYGSTRKEALKIILDDAKRLNAPVIKYADDFSKYQAHLKDLKDKGLKAALSPDKSMMVTQGKKAAEKFVNSVIKAIKKTKDRLTGKGTALADNKQKEAIYQLSKGMPVEDLETLKGNVLGTRKDIEDMSKKEAASMIEALKRNRSLESFGSTTKIVKQRKIHGHLVAPVYEAEANVVKQMPELRGKPLGGWIENPIRTFEELGEPVKELIYRPVKIAEKNAKTEYLKLEKEINALQKGLSRKSSKRIGAYAVAQQKGGADILKSMKIPAVELTPKEAEAYKVIRSHLEQLYDRLQEARKISGRKPFNKVENYFTFFRELSELEKLGFSPALMNESFIHPRATAFRFEKKRKKSLKAVDLNAFKVFKKYAESALEHIHKSPAIAKGRELTGVIGKGKERYLLRDEKPRAHRFLTEWLDAASGKKQTGKYLKLPPNIEKGIDELNRNLAFAVLSGNIRSAVIQPTALVNTAAEIGPKYLSKGIAGIFSPSIRKFAMDKSNVLITRKYDVAISDAIRGLTGAKKTIGEIGLAPLQLLDMETALATWWGAFKKGKEYYKMAEEKAIKYADDVVTKTQASAQASDLAPIQRTSLGKALSLFQTFVINNWGFLNRDVLGINNASIKNTEAFKKAITFLAGATLTNIFYEDLLGTHSPFPTPVRAFSEALERGEDTPSASLQAAKELIELVPIVGGGIRYGTSPFGAPAGLALELTKKIAAEGGDGWVGWTRPWGELAGKTLGVPGTSQIYKALRGKKRGESTIRALLGTNKTGQRYRKKPVNLLKNFGTF